MRRVRILIAAAYEAEEAVSWYENGQPGLGQDFKRAIETALDVLEENFAP